jgi:hypothetical protein
MRGRNRTTDTRIFKLRFCLLIAIVEYHMGVIVGRNTLVFRYLELSDRRYMLI